MPSAIPARVRRWITRIVPLVLVANALACVHVFRRVEVSAVDMSTGEPVTVRSPVKAHLRDGSTVVFAQGVTVGGDTVRGWGARHDIRLVSDGPREQAIPLDSIIGMETFRQRHDVPSSVLISAAATGATVAAASLLAVAIFGSCPTVYAMPDSTDTFALEAEVFSFSIAPLLEGRDVDRLSVGPDQDGRVRLEVRNEALETHYINHLELLAVSHLPDERVLPDGRMEQIAARDILAPSIGRDRIGRDVRDPLRAIDDVVFSSAAPAIAEAVRGDLEERIELAIPAPDVDSVAVILRARSSLLTTVLLYDYVLGAPGARALDWLASGIEEISTAIELGTWFNERMGLRVSVWEAGRWKPVIRLPDYGPIAWRDLAVMVPVPKDANTLRVRLAFAPDGWRIDYAAFALSTRRPTARSVPLARLLDHDDGPSVAALEALRQPDSLYVETHPGHRFTIEFEVGTAQRDSLTTLLLASQGYYTEWIRGSWIKNASGEPFRPSDGILVRTLERWVTVKDSMETQFHAARIPVR